VITFGAWEIARHLKMLNPIKGSKFKVRGGERADARYYIAPSIVAY